MKSLFALAPTRRSESATVAVATSDGLLWPTQLLHELSEHRRQHNFALPLAITTFVLSAILGIVIGPMQLILLAATTDYTWVTNVYYPSALNCVLLIGSFVALLAFVSLLLAWRAHESKARLSCLLSAGSLFEILAIWLFGAVCAWQPHRLTLALTAIILVFILAALFLGKEYLRPTAHLHPGTQIALTMFSVLSLVCVVLGPIYLSQNSPQVDSAEIAQLAAHQAQARVSGIPSVLSDLTFAVCNNSNYQVIYYDESSTSGIFECTNTHEVYTVVDPQLPAVNSVRGLAMYLGTTQDPAISRAFPTSYYIYHYLPQASPEAELALVASAFSETELVDNFAQPILDYWQNHSQTNLFLNLFYTNSLHEIENTSDYILLAALGTISMSDQLPHGNTISSYLNGDIVDYSFRPDTELTALNTFGATPSLYPVAIREALRSHRHISVHITAGAEYDLDSMRQLLQDSFVEAS